MVFGAWDSVVNAVLLVFWLRMWAGEHRSLVFNQYLSPLARLTDSISDFLRPVFAGLPVKAVMGICLLALLLLRGLAIRPDSPGFIAMGFEVRTPFGEVVLPRVAFSFLSFAKFLFQVWGLSLLYCGGRSSLSGAGHAQEALAFVARPFTFIPRAARPGVLLVFGAAIALSLGLLGHQVPGLSVAAEETIRGRLPLTAGLGAVLCALQEGVNLLSIIRSALVVLIIGALVSMFAGSQLVLFVCRDWTDLLLGPARRFPLRIGPLDLTPLLFLFVAGILYQWLTLILRVAYSGLFG
ncbi:MAG: YggT family protein [Lentisphaerae bacterium]|nr:YggT family protein [Lentisphaerota bacterium]